MYQFEHPVARREVEDIRNTLLRGRVQFEGVHREWVEAALSVLDRILHV